MSQPNCPRCHNPVSEELPGGLCPTCLMAAALASSPAITSSHPHPKRQPALTVAEVAEQFPELEVFELIGQGGMGAVYRVRQKNLDRVVALKVFLAQPNDVEFAARFQREARALAKLNHPNIVTVHDFGQRGSTHFLIMEYVDGLNLRQLSAAEKLSPKIALQMVPQLCDALQFAHDRGVIHRDIKPENLLVSSAGGIKIADFGLAKMTGSDLPDSLTRTQQVMGTLNYMAPEQRDRPTQVDHRADIYSLGVVIYEMLTGELPLGRFLPPSSKSDIDARLDEAVMRALEREPERRYQQASEFKTGLSDRGPSHPATGNFGFAANVARMFNSPRPPVKSSAYHGSAEPIGRRFTFTMMSGRERTGNWQAGGKQTIFTIMGGTELDLTQVTAKEVDLTLFTLMGGVEVTVPHGAVVDVDGLMVMGAITDRVAVDESISQPMRVRVRAWGIMGGCEVKTPKVIAPVAPRKKSWPGNQDIAGTRIGHGLVFIYRMIAMLLSVAIPIVFISGAFDVVEEDESRLAGVITALTVGMIWAGLPYFRVLVRGGPGATDEASVRKYQSATIVGALIRGCALMPAFACPILFVIANFEHRPNDENIQFAGIICAIVAVALFSFAKYAEDYFYGPRE